MFVYLDMRVKKSENRPEPEVPTTVQKDQKLEVGGAHPVLWLLFVITRPELLVEFSGHPLLCHSRSHLLHKFCQTSGTKAIISIHRASLSYIRPKNYFHCVEEDQNETLP